VLLNGSLFDGSAHAKNFQNGAYQRALLRHSWQRLQKTYPAPARAETSRLMREWVDHSEL